MTGYLDTNDNGKVLMAQTSGTCVTNPSGRDVLTINGGGASSFALYPTDQGVLMFQLDNGRSGIGMGLPQSSSAIAANTLAGNYAVSSQSAGYIDTIKNLAAGSWADLAGQINADGISSFTGVVDVDQLDGHYIGASGVFWTQTPNSAITGSFASGAQGRFTGSFTTDAAATPTNTTGLLPQIFYVVDNSTVLFQESDTTTAVGTLQLQNF
jgi:hypothetical protein